MALHRSVLAALITCETVCAAAIGALAAAAFAVAPSLAAEDAVIIPAPGAALSAAGALMSDLAQVYRATRFVSTTAFDFAAAAVSSTLAPSGASARKLPTGSLLITLSGSAAASLKTT